MVYLPPGYHDETDARYPVLYMHDGQNVFDAATAFLNHEWGVDETAQALIAASAIEALIIVAIYNAGLDRIEEYTPTRDTARRAGGHANEYGRMIVEELKPFIDRTYRTRVRAADTALAGSSLGGLVTLYLGLRYPATFSKLAVLSPSVWWDNRFIVRRINLLSSRPALRIWLSVGVEEGYGVIDAARRVRDALVAKGWALDDDLTYHECEGAAHHETAWAAMVSPMLRFLFPP